MDAVHKRIVRWYILQYACKPTDTRMHIQSCACICACVGKKQRKYQMSNTKDLTQKAGNEKNNKMYQNSKQMYTFV